MIDLKQFCSRDGYLPNMTAPFTRAGFTWATDGHILVRVLERLDVPKVDAAPHAEEVLRSFDGVELTSFPIIAWPPEPCDECEGTGLFTPPQSVAINGVIFDVKYIKMIAALPGAQFEVSPPKELEPALFQFEGGIGGLMPMRYASKGTRHLGDLDALAKVGDDQPEAQR